MTRKIIGGIEKGDVRIVLVDDPLAMERSLEQVRIELRGDGADLGLAELRRLKEALNHAERVLLARQQQTLLERNLALPL